MAGATESPAAPPAGSARWYAWLFTPAAARETLALLFQLESELRSIVVSPKDHGVAHLKLQWWREEIRRLAAGTPRHPITQALAAAAPHAASAWLPLDDFLTSLELELAAAAVDDDAELGRFLALADGHARTIALSLGGEPDSTLEALGADAGQAIRGAQIVADWCASPMDEPRRDAVMRLATQTRTRWARACAALSDSRLASLRGLRVLGELHLALLGRLEKTGFRPGTRPELPAMQSLWTAWRAARQHAPS